MAKVQRKENLEVGKKTSNFSSFLGKKNYFSHITVEKETSHPVWGTVSGIREWLFLDSQARLCTDKAELSKVVIKHLDEEDITEGVS